MASQALSYAELLVGGVLMAAGITGKNPIQLVSGSESPLSGKKGKAQASPGKVHEGG